MEQKCANCGNGKWRDGITAITDNCIECKYVDKDGKLQPSNWKPKVSSNADLIRAMSDEELAEWMYNGISTDPCDYCEYNNGHCDGAPCRGKADAETIIEWLKQPVEGD